MYLCNIIQGDGPLAIRKSRKARINWHICISAQAEKTKQEGLHRKTMSVIKINR